MDKLIVKGLGKRLDGEYEFSIANVMTLGHPESLTNRESHRLKTMSGVRLGELDDALSAGDSDVFMFLGAMLLARAGKSVDEEVLWNSPAGDVFDFEFENAAKATPEEAGDGESPPESEPPLSEQPSTSGGSSSEAASDPPANGQSPTGLHVLERSATSAPATSAT